MIISRLDGKAVEGQTDGKVKFMTANIANPAQKWTKTLVGNQFVNLKSGKALEIHVGRSWTFDDKMRIVNSRDSTKVLGTSWAHDNGRDVFMWTKNEAWVDPTQTFCIVPSKNTKTG